MLTSTRMTQTGSAFLLFVLPGFLVFCPAFAQKSIDEIIALAEDQLKGTSSQGTFEMTIVRPEYTRTMKMDSWWVGNDKALIVVKSPKKEKGNKTLKIGNEMWTYLRATETTIKIPPSMMLQSWNGSDFTNDDLVRESSIKDDYTASLLGEEPVDGQACWKIQLLPKENAPVVWGRLYYWVRQKDYLPSVVEYYDEKGTLMRYMVYTDVQLMGGRRVPSRWTMYDKTKKDHRTEFRIFDIEFDIRIKDSIFSFQELEKGN